MPIIKSAIKRARQANKRNERNNERASQMRSLMRNILRWTKDGEKEKAEQMFPQAQKAIDMAAKKHLIHKNNAARKKARLAKAMNAAGAQMTTAVKVSGKSEVKKAVSGVK